MSTETSRSGAPGRVARAYVALGSNLGDREEYLRSATLALGRLGEVVGASSAYETEPVGTVVQSDFLNAVVELRTRLEPEELLAQLLRIEREHGRDRSASSPKGPRTLDLDLLTWDARVMRTPSLTLPHPAMAGRGFVLAPLAEIAPEWRHPVNGKGAQQLLAELAKQMEDSPRAVRKIPVRGIPQGGASSA